MPKEELKRPDVSPSSYGVPASAGVEDFGAVLITERDDHARVGLGEVVVKEGLDGGEIGESGLSWCESSNE